MVFLGLLEATGPANRLLRRKILRKQIDNLASRKPKTMSTEDYFNAFDKLVDDFADYALDRDELTSAKYRVYF